MPRSGVRSQPRSEAEWRKDDATAFVRDFLRDWRAAPLDTPTRALLDLAEKSTRAPDSIAAADIERLRALGWSDEAIHDAVQVSGYFNYINRVADALGVEPDEWLVEFEKELGLTQKEILNS